MEKLNLILAFGCGCFFAMMAATFWYFRKVDEKPVDTQKNPKTIDFSSLIPSASGKSFSVKKKRTVKYNDDIAGWKKEREEH